MTLRDELLQGAVDTSRLLQRAADLIGALQDLNKNSDGARRLAHLEKMIVWYQDITMTGKQSEEYENGFWDAVDLVKYHQIGEKGHN